MTEAEDLDSGALVLGVELAPTQSQQMLRFAELLRRWNVAFNLVSRRDVARLLARHLLDALSLAPMLRGSCVLDLGTGAGLPGVPLAIVHPEMKFTLIDRSERRIRFVRQVVIDLGLPNVQAVAVDFDDFRAVGLFDTVVSRAVAKPEALWRVAADLLAPDGRALFQVGENEAQFTDFNASVKTVRVSVPGLEQPHHVLLVSHRKTAKNMAKQDAGG